MIPNVTLLGKRSTYRVLVVSTPCRELRNIPDHAMMTKRKKPTQWISCGPNNAPTIYLSNSNANLDQASITYSRTINSSTCHKLLKLLYDKKKKICRPKGISIVKTRRCNLEMLNRSSINHPQIHPPPGPPCQYSTIPSHHPLHHSTDPVHPLHLQRRGAHALGWQGAYQCA